LEAFLPNRYIQGKNAGMDTVNWILDAQFLNIEVWRFLNVLLFIFMTTGTMRIIKIFWTKKHDSLHKKADDKLWAAVVISAKGPLTSILWIFTVSGTILLLNIDLGEMSGAIQTGLKLSLLGVFFWFLLRLVNNVAELAQANTSHKGEKAAIDKTLIPFIVKSTKVFLFLTGTLMIAQNLGYSISGVIASLGIGGIAVAMAAKDTISNVFGSIMILTDRPFKIGDWIKGENMEGVVEEIGFRSTKIRKFDRTIINVPNSKLADMTINNIQKMDKRRIKTRIDIEYGTSREKVEEAIKSIKNILKHHSGVDQEFSLVNFDEFKESSLSIFLYYFSTTTVWHEYLQVREDVNLQIMREFENIGVEFAFPSRTIYIKRGNS